MADLYLYLIFHTESHIKTHTYIGCVEDFTNRLNQHNGLVAGGPRVTRKAAGSWRPVMLLKIPKERNLNSKSIKKEWKQTSRGLESRIHKGFTLAVKYNLNVYIMKNSISSIPVINILENKWKDHRVEADKTTWSKLLNND